MAISKIQSSRRNLYLLVVSAMLTAIGIIIPLVSPLKVVLEPASFTLASHVALIIAMFVSPVCAAAVAVGTTAGFFLGGFPIVIVMRAATQIIFAVAGAIYLKKYPDVLDKTVPMISFAFLINLVHATAEVLVVIPFYFGNQLKDTYYSKGFLISVVLLVGVGTVIHGLVDFFIARAVWVPLKNMTRRNLQATSRT